MATRDQDDRLATIRALLAKAEATPFPEEADAFNAKASQLMARYAVDEAVLWASAGVAASDVVEVRMEILPPFAGQKLWLVCAVAEAQGCMALQVAKAEAWRPAEVALVGPSGSVAAVEALVTSLLVQLASAMPRAEASHRDELAQRLEATLERAGPARESSRMRARAAARPSGSDTSAWRRSFIMGFASTVVERLRSQREAAARERDEAYAQESSTGSENAPSTSLVLARHDAHVRDEFRRRYPHVRSSRVSMGSSSLGHVAGSSAGSRADLGGRRLGDRRALPR